MENDETNRSPKSGRLKPKISNFIRKAKDGTTDFAHMVIRRKDDDREQSTQPISGATTDRRRNTSPARPVGRTSSKEKTIDSGKSRSIHTNKPIFTANRKEREFVPKPMRKVSNETIARLREKREKEKELDDDMAPTEFERIAVPANPANPDAKRKVATPRISSNEDDAPGTRELPAAPPKPSKPLESSFSTKSKVVLNSQSPKKRKNRVEKPPRPVPEGMDATIFERIDAPLMPANPDAKIKVPAAPRAIMCALTEEDPPKAASAEVIPTRELSREEVKKEKEENFPKTATEVDMPTAKGGTDFSVIVAVKTERQPVEQKKPDAEKYVYEKTFVKNGSGNLIPRWSPVLQKPKEAEKAPPVTVPEPEKTFSAERDQQEKTAVPKSRSNEDLPEKSMYSNSSCVVS